MSYIHADIELTNQIDLIDAKRHVIGEEEIKRIRVRALVDTRVYYLCINETIQKILQLPISRKKRFRLANDEVVECDIVGPLELRFENRWNTCDAVVLPGDSEVLLGYIPLQGMDVLIDPLRRELIINPAYPDGAIVRLC